MSVRVRIIGFILIALAAAACVSAPGEPLSPAEQCLRNGWRWIPALGYCEVSR